MSFPPVATQVIMIATKLSKLDTDLEYARRWSRRTHVVDAHARKKMYSHFHSKQGFGYARVIYTSKGTSTSESQQARADNSELLELVRVTKGAATLGSI